MMTDIIDRIPMYTNEMMLKECEILKYVVTQHEIITVGRGKKIEKIKKPKHKIDKEVLEKIIRSCDHYKKLCEMGVKEVLVSGTIQFRDYQYDIIKNGADILLNHGFLYLAMEVRTGKTLTSLGIAGKINASNVLFITKKKAIRNIEKDYKDLSPSFSLCVINYESLHTIDPDIPWDLIICDEAHGMGAFPKPSERSLMVSSLIKKWKPRVILLSGTPTPESYSQMYHQVYGIPKNPFSEFKNFYRFCDKYVDVKQKIINGFAIKDYSNGKSSILIEMEPYTINYTQQEAGFKAETVEEILSVKMSDLTYGMIRKLKKDLVIEGKEETILADTPVKLMSKVHQLSSGTIKFESGNSMIIDLSKAEFIKSQFEGCKIGIFYKFKEEYNALKNVFGDDLTNDLSVFEDTDKNIALQIVSGREGISLRDAEYLVYYNIDFSATSYWQSKDRMTTKERLENKVFWVFSEGGIEHDIYKSVIKKKDYTLNHFRKQLKD
jgi:hypothetical protein